jgi:shikimate dehydrogenase
MKRYGLIGFPLTHSFSSEYFNEKFRREEIDAEYVNLPLKSISEFTEKVRAAGPFSGLNVTVPYKEQVIPFLGKMSPEAYEIGAVNLIKITEKGGMTEMKGFNTDASAFLAALRHYGVVNPARALILGSGGASKAVNYALRKMGVETRIVSREKGRADLTYEDLEKTEIGLFDLIINASPLGMFPDVDNAPRIPYGQLGSDNVLFDLVYNPAETKFLQMGRQAGCKTINGLKMLHFQAEEGWKIWQSTER